EHQLDGLRRASLGGPFMKTLVRIFILSTFAVASFLGLHVFGSVAEASVNINDESTSESMFVRVEENARSFNAPRTFSKPKSSSTPRKNGSTNTGGGGGQSSNRQATVDTRAKWARSILRTLCTVDGNFGASFGQCAAPAQPAPAPAAPAPQTQTQVVSEPVTITITSSDLLELIPNSPEILTDRGPWGLKNAHTN